MLQRASTWRAVAVICVGAAVGLTNTGFILASGLLVGSVAPAVRAGLGSPEGHRALSALGTLAGVSLVSALLSVVQGHGLSVRYVLAVRETLARVMLTPPGIAHLNDPEVAAQLAALDQADRSGIQTDIGWPLLTVTSSFVSGLGAAVLLIGFRWWAPIVMVSGWIVVNRVFRTWVKRGTGELWESSARRLRRSSYYRELTVGRDTAKELRIFGLADWAVAQFTAAWAEAMSTVWSQRRSANKMWLTGIAAVVVIHVVVLSALGLAASRGQVGIGALAVYGQAILGTSGLGLMSDLPVYLERAASVDAQLLNLEEHLVPTGPFVVNLRPAEPAQPNAPAAPRPLVALPADAPSQCVCFEGVGFAYPGQEKPILDGLDLVIPAGQSLAIVGNNGAGKSSLIRLLCALYAPHAGRITVDGVDLARVDPDGWRTQVGVIFQDFVHYQLPLADNVGLGHLRLLEDRCALSAALQRAGAGRLTDDLPWGWDTILAPNYQRGVDLSGGQWQKVALARALLAVEGGANLLILDEPTASLDVRAEIALFERFVELTEGITTILVSHRLSSVRRAERIVVLDGGRIVEDGNHDQLIASGGRYAALFSLQARRFNGPIENDRDRDA